MRNNKDEGHLQLGLLSSKSTLFFCGTIYTQDSSIHVHSYHIMRIYIRNMHTLLHQKKKNKKLMQNIPLRPTNNLKEHLTRMLGALVGLPEHQIMRLLSFIQNLHIMHIHSKREITLVHCCLPAPQGLAETQLELLEQHWNTKLADPFWEGLTSHTHMLSSTGRTQIYIMAMGSPLIQ